jgi:hypothetical protein
MTDEEIVRKVLSEVVDELKLPEYLKRELEIINLQSSLDGKEIDNTIKKVWAMIIGTNKHYLDAMAITIARLKQSGFFK